LRTNKRWWLLPLVVVLGGFVVLFVWAAMQSERVVDTGLGDNGVDDPLAAAVAARESGAVKANLQ
jgi:hypothetical protein